MNCMEFEAVIMKYFPVFSKEQGRYHNVSAVGRLHVIHKLPQAQGT